LLFVIAAAAAAGVAAVVWYVDGQCWSFKVALQWQLEEACLQGTQNGTAGRETLDTPICV
jgi:putative IMPACT (imprinted ancient) family translation regulator